MFVSCPHQNLASIAAEIAAAIEVAESYRDELANPEARDKWHGIWLSIEVMVDWLFEEEAKFLHALGALDWLAVANAHAAVMAPIRAMIGLCRSGQAHRRANLGALGDIILMLVLHKARYDRPAVAPAPSLPGVGNHHRQSCTTLQ